MATPANSNDAAMNKAVILKFFHIAETDGVAKALDLVAEDAVWWVQGRPPLGGTYTKAEITKVLLKALESIDGGWKFDIKAVTAEEDRVSVESENEARFINGTTYHGHYHFLFRLKNGQIKEVKEYLDTLYVHETYVKPFLA